MRKRLINPTAERPGTLGQGWLDLERAAVVEVTSEDKDFPVEAAFISGDARGWRGSAGQSDNSANLRSAANAQMHIVGF